MARTPTLSLMLLATWLAAPVVAEGIAWRSDFEAAKREAAASGRLVLLHFSGPNCQPCRMMEQTVFNRDDVARAVEQNYVPVAVDTKENAALARQYSVRPIPSDVIVNPHGQVLNRSMGAKSAQEYVAALSQVARLTPRPSAGRQAAATPSPAAAGRPGATSGLAASQPATTPAPSYQLTAPPGASAQPRAAANVPARPQPMSFADRVAGRHVAQQPGAQHPASQQHSPERMLQPPPAPGTGSPGTAGRGAALAGPPANMGSGPAPAWRQQHLAAPGQPSGPSARPAVVGNPFAAPPGNVASSSVPQPNRGPLATPSWSAPAAAYHPLPNPNQPAPPSPNTAGTPGTPGAATRPNGPPASAMASNTGGTPPRPAASLLAAPPLGPRARAGVQPSAPPGAPLAQAAAPPGATAAPPGAASAPQGAAATAPASAVAPGTPGGAPPAGAAAPGTPGTQPPGPPGTLPAASAAPLVPGAAPQAFPTIPSPPAPAQAPPTPPSAFGGFCCVTMHHEGRWTQGDRRWGVIHEGKLYLFVSEQAKDAFWREAERYAPVFGGDDVVLFVDTGKHVPGKVGIGARQGDPEQRTYLFANEESYQKFYWNAPFYIERLRQLTGGASGR